MIGDVLTSSILCEAIKDRFPESETHYLINTHTLAVLEHNPFIDKKIVFTPEMKESISLRKGLKTALKKEKYDVVIDVYSKLGSAEITKKTGAKIRVGYTKWYTKWAYTHTYTYNKNLNTIAGLAIDNRMQLLTPLQNNFHEFYIPKIYLTLDEKTNAKLKLKTHNITFKQPIIMISLLGSSPEKTYPIAYMAKILDHLISRKKYQLLLNYIPNQQEQVKQLLSLIKNETRKMVFDAIYGKSLREFLVLCSNCQAIIGNEGGAINMAKALDIPSFSIFSPWVRKEAWGLFESERNKSFHLKDIQPEMFYNKKTKNIKKEHKKFYNQMKPESIIPSLETFLHDNLD